MEDIISTFVEISGMERDEAVQFLSSKNWNLELSINEFLTKNEKTQENSASSSGKSKPRQSPKPKDSTRKQPSERPNLSFLHLIKRGMDSLLWILKWTLTLILGKDEIKRISGEELVQTFQRNFGSNHPEFFRGTYSQALEKGKRETLWVLIALYVPDHPGNKEFCKNIINSTHLSAFLRQKSGIFWMGDTRTEQGLQGIFFINK